MITPMEILIKFLLFTTSFYFLTTSSTAADTIAATQTIRDADGTTIISAGGNFELGFFSPGISQNRYVGIWYKKISAKTVAWVANREIPLTDTSGALQFNGQGVLELSNGAGTIVWSSNSSKFVKKPVAQLLDTGNFIIRDENGSHTQIFTWQSFDYPVDTFLPGMKIGRDLITGLDIQLSSWKSPDDPSQGEFNFWLDPDGYPQIFLNRSSMTVFRSGPWNGIQFSGVPNLKPNPIYTFGFVINKREIHYTYELINPSVLSRMVLSPIGCIQRFTWIVRTQSWVLYSTGQMDNCDSYALCGPYGTCNINNSPACGCLEGFKPKVREEWDVADWSSGCVRKNQLSCGHGDGFVKYSGMKLPDTQKSWFNTSMNLEDCEMMCLKNCSCTAYANTDIRGSGSGCMHWFGDLMDIREFNQDGQDLYVKMPSSELYRIRRSKGNRLVKIVVIIPVLLIGAVILGLYLLNVLVKRKKLKRQGITCFTNERRDLELKLFDYKTIANATNNFSEENKLGQGGFGPVFKGMLEEGQEIAVKRLSKTSRQGVEELKNEVLLISKLQHRNLVKLIGCCIEEEESMLIYEYMPNKSLDYFIFDEGQRATLDWPKCNDIINGIARGLLYLHEDSRLRIVHRDLKASNILLDHEMNPKISDFGMARSFRGNQTQANTTRVAGTYGYMAPEYAVDGLFSIKSDVFSWGVLVLEIVSGMKNRGFYHPEHNFNLLGHAWRLFTEGKAAELIDPLRVESDNLDEVVRTIQIGLLCVQQYPEDRPSMSTVVLMLGSEISLPQPQQPGFFSERRPPRADSSSRRFESCSADQHITFSAPR